MDKEVYNSAHKLIQQAENVGSIGERISLNELDKLNKALNSRLPEWFIHLYNSIYLFMWIRNHYKVFRF
ncbi:hypothetical protein CN514_24525 [Bacillus sp. AFS001701]|uniref:hypothetical protein n=1 Tax=Bacillus sp. AFS001701 TaxID=2033480 RepID=UPI000BF3130F|nr:hypothetical protein [Bacillus sp. AFS001701]PET36733.1 hypothetical protein CN514_24525 [Bacillus sp. AFS001701]